MMYKHLANPGSSGPQASGEADSLTKLTVVTGWCGAAGIPFRGFDYKGKVPFWRVSLGVISGHMLQGTLLWVTRRSNTKKTLQGKSHYHL
jgi:hypothetical protein